MRSILMLSAPCICKGYIGKLAEQQHGDAIAVIGTGGLIRDEMRVNHNFRRMSEDLVLSRRLLPDGEIYRLVHKRMQYIQDPRTILLLDGFRTTAQFAWLEDVGLLSANNSIAIHFTAPREVAFKRALDRQKRQPDGTRADDASMHGNFDAGQDLFQSIWPNLESDLQCRGVRIHTLDASGDIQQTVFPEVDLLLTHLQSVPVARSAPPASQARAPRRGGREHRSFAYAH